MFPDPKNKSMHSPTFRRYLELLQTKFNKTIHKSFQRKLLKIYLANFNKDYSVAGNSYNKEINHERIVAALAGTVG